MTGATLDVAVGYSRITGIVVYFVRSTIPQDAVGYNGMAVDKVAPSQTENNAFYQGYLGDGTKNPFKDWLTFNILGAVLGGFISGAISGRNKLMVEKGPRIKNGKRFLFEMTDFIMVY